MICFIVSHANGIESYKQMNCKSELELSTSCCFVLLLRHAVYGWFQPLSIVSSIVVVINIHLYVCVPFATVASRVHILG